MLPAVALGVKAEVAVPDEAGPVQLEALDVEFGGDVLQEERGTDVRDGVQEPRDDVGLGADVDGERLEAEGLRGDEHAVAFGAAGVLAEPLFRLVQIARQDNGITLPDVGVGSACGGHVEIEQLVHEEGQRLGAIRALGDRQMQVLLQVDVGVVGQEGGHISFGVFFVREAVGDIDLPVGEGLVQGLDPEADAAFAGVDLLSPAHQADDGCPVFVLVQRPDEEFALGHREVGETFLAGEPGAEVAHVPHTLGFVENGDVLHFGRVGLGGLGDFGWVNLYSSALDGHF